jgi:hypothetical protein
MRKTLILLAFQWPILAMAQVGIGTGASAPDASAQLEVKSTSRGFLPPRVALTATNNTSSPIASPVEGLLVYNTATAGTAPNNVTPGFYYYSGSAWVRLADRKSTVIARKTGDATGYERQGTRLVEGWTEVVDVNNDFNTNGTFTAPRTGLYLINFSFMTTGQPITANSVLEAHLQCSAAGKSVKSVTSFPQGVTSGNILDAGAQISAVVNLAAGETIRPALWHNIVSSGNIQLKNDADFNHFSVVEL